MAVYVLCSLKINVNRLAARSVSLGVEAFHSSRLNLNSQENKELNISDDTMTNYVEDGVTSSVEDSTVLEKRNKSRLVPKHQNVVHGNPPYTEPVIPYHNSHAYHRKMFGRYGLKSGVTLAELWPTNEELKKAIAYESIVQPDSIQVMVARAKLIASDALEVRRKREDEINSKMEKLEQWKLEIQQKAEKKLMEAQAAKERKERLVEEVRRHFGFKVDPRDERFKELLQQKEKEEAKREKAEKKKAKQAKMLAKMVDPSTVAPSKELK